MLCWPFPMESVWRISTSVLSSERKHSLPGMTTITLLAWLGKNFTMSYVSNYLFSWWIDRIYGVFNALCQLHFSNGCLLDAAVNGVWQRKQEHSNWDLRGPEIPESNPCIPDKVCSRESASPCPCCLHRPPETASFSFPEVHPLQYSLMSLISKWKEAKRSKVFKCLLFWSVF